MSSKTRFMGIVKARSGESEVIEATAATVAPRIVEPRAPLDDVQSARALEDAAIAYTEVVQVLDALTRTAKAGGDGLTAPSLDASIEHLELAWGRWDSAHRRLIGSQRTA